MPPQDSEQKRLEDRLEALGIGYTRMEMCLIEVARQIQALVEQNAALLQAALEKEPEEEEPLGYLSLKARKG